MKKIEETEYVVQWRARRMADSAAICLWMVVTQKLSGDLHFGFARG